MTKQELTEVINETTRKILNIASAITCGILAYVVIDAVIAIHNDHGKEIYQAAEQGDKAAINIIRYAGNGDAISKWLLGVNDSASP